MGPVKLHENFKKTMFLCHRHEQKLTEASFVANDLFIENEDILLFLKESTMLH